MGRIFTIGEALIDFIPVKPTALKDVESFIKLPGGAPANVAVAASKLGAETYFIGMLGKDAFGDFLTETLEKYNVKTDYLYKTTKSNTALAFVSLDESGERDFSFYRNPSADMLLSKEDVKDIKFNKTDIISFCSVDLVEYPVKYATELVLKNIHSVGGTVLFDPNVRKALWNNLDECRNTILYFSKYADIIKISDDEMEFITGESDLSKGIDFLKNLGIKNIVITLGKDGAVAYFGDIEVRTSGNKVNVVDTTGAGDAFVGSFLYMLDKIGKEISELNAEDIKKILVFSNSVAALVTTKKGAMSSLPTIDEINVSQIIF